MWYNIYMNNNTPLMMTTSEYAKMRGIARRTVLLHLKKGKIQGIKKGRDWIIFVKVDKSS